MKKLLYFIILTFLLIPFAVRAEINLEEIHDSISKDNEITVKSIPLEQYKETDYFNTCMDKFYSPTEEQCLAEIYGELVVSKIKKDTEIPNSIDVRYQNCDIEKHTCEISVRKFGFNKGDPVIEIYKINFEELETTKRPSKMQTSYKMYDLGYINQILNYGSVSNYFSDMQQSAKIFKMYPGLKEEMNKNKQFEFSIGTTFGGSGEFTFGSGAKLIAYYNDIAVDMSEISYTTHKILFISDKIPKTKEAYIKEAERRIKEYINDDAYEFKIEFSEQYTYEYCELYPASCEVQDVFEQGDKYSFEMYSLYINGTYYELDLMPVPEKEIKKLKVKSKDYENDISVETESSDVPLDTSVKAEDLTIKYKGFLKAYDIDLYSGIKDEYITQVKDGIIVRIPLPDEYDKKKLEIYHIKEDGTKGEKYKAIVEEIDGKKYAVFTTNHFSIYAIEEEIEEEIKDTGKEEVKDDIKEEIKQEETENPNTYDGIGNSIILLALSILGIIGIGLYLRKKERNEI